MPSKTAVIRARCEPELKARILRLLSLPKFREMEVDETKLLRIASKEYCEKHERLLNLNPITPKEVDELFSSGVGGAVAKVVKKTQRAARDQAGGHIGGKV